MRSKFEGCLMGLAIGDAMAAIGVGEKRTDVPLKYGQITSPRGGGKLNLEPGEYTNEGQMMVSVLESICTLRAFKPDNIASRFVGWLKSHPCQIDPFSQHVLERMRDGERWAEASESASFDTSLPVANSASLTYAIPVGLLWAGNPAKMNADTITCAHITQWDNRAVDGSLIVNYTINLLLKDEPNPWPKVLEFARDKDERLMGALQEVSTLKYEDIDTSGYAPKTLQGAFWFLLNSKSYEEGIIKAASLGGDYPDAIGALAGAFLGAKFGRFEIPERWVIHLRGQDRIDVLASRLYELSGV